MWKNLLKIGSYALAAKQIADQAASVRQERLAAHRRRRNKDMVIGATIGAGIATTAALMLTPRTGGQTRRALVRQTAETLGHLRHRVSGGNEDRDIEQGRQRVRQTTRGEC